MVRIEIEIREIENGWIVEDSYYDEEKFCDTFLKAKTYANKLFTKFQNDEQVK